MKTLCLSSGESELAAIVKGTAEALGMKSVLSDLGYSVNLCLESDATAAIGIVKRQGLGAAPPGHCRSVGTATNQGQRAQSYEGWHGRGYGGSADESVACGSNFVFVRQDGLFLCRWSLSNRSCPSKFRE